MKLEVEISKEIVAPLIPTHRNLVGRVAEALVNMSKALEAESDFRSALETKDIKYLSLLKPMTFRGVGLLADRDSAVNSYLKEAAEYGVEGLPVFREPELPGAARVRLKATLCGPDGVGWPRSSPSCEFWFAVLVSTALGRDFRLCVNPPGFCSAVASGEQTSKGLPLAFLFGGAWFQWMLLVLIDVRFFGTVCLFGG